VTDPRTRMGAFKAVSLAVLGSSALTIVGHICREVAGGPPGAAAEGFFSTLGAGVFGHCLVPLFAQKHMSRYAVSRSLRAGLALATAVAIVSYLEADGGFSTIDIAITVLVSLAILPMVISWIRLLRHEATDPPATDVASPIS